MTSLTSQYFLTDLYIILNPYRCSVELRSTARSVPPGPVSSSVRPIQNVSTLLIFCHWIPAFKIRRSGILRKNNLDQIVGIHKNDVGYKGLNKLCQANNSLEFYSKRKTHNTHIKEMWFSFKHTSVIFRGFPVPERKHRTLATVVITSKNPLLLMFPR